MHKWTAKNFKPHEFACKCGKPGCAYATDKQVIAAMDVSPIQPHYPIIEIVQNLRNEALHPLTITSGFRCDLHPIAIAKKKKRGAKWRGAHGVGWAVDIKWPKDRFARENFMLRAAWHFLHNNIAGIGVAKSFLHIDIGHPDKVYMRGRKAGVVIDYGNLPQRLAEYRQHLNYVKAARWNTV